MLNSTKRTSTFENYCRERKSFLDHDGVSDSEILVAADGFEMDELVELMSVESFKEKATAATEDTDPITDCQSWSLSSNSIITAWYENDDEAGHATSPSKSIVSYASDAKGLFSPLYEVTSEHTNVFKDNRHKLSRAGFTPKFGNVSYKDRKECYDSTTEVLDDMEIEQSKTMGSNSSASTLNSMNSGNISAKPLQTKRFVNYNRDVAVESSNSKATGTQTKKKTKVNAPRTFDAYLRGEWSLDPLESMGSGDLSLEPILEAFDSLKSVSTAPAVDSDCCAASTIPLFTKVSLKYVEPEINTIIDSKSTPLGQEGRFILSVIEEESMDSDALQLRKDTDEVYCDENKVFPGELKSESLFTELPFSGTYSSGSVDCYAVNDREKEGRLDRGENQDSTSQSAPREGHQRGNEKSTVDEYQRQKDNHSVPSNPSAAEVRVGFSLLKRGTKLRVINTVRHPSPQSVSNDLLYSSYRTLKNISLEKDVLSTFQHTPTFRSATKGLPNIEWQCCGDSCLNVTSTEDATNISLFPKQLDMHAAQSPVCKIMFWCDENGISRLTIRSPRSIFGDNRRSNSITFDADELKERLVHWRKNGSKNVALLLNYKTSENDESQSENRVSARLAKPLAVQSTETYETQPDDGSYLDLDLSVVSSLFDTTSRNATPSSVSTFRIEDDIERPFLGPLKTSSSHDSSAFVYDNDNLNDEELRTVMKLTKDGDELSIIFPAFSCETICDDDSDDGLSDIAGALSEIQDLKKDGDELSIVSSAFLCETIGDGDSDDGLSDEVDALSEIQDNLRATLEAAASKARDRLPFSLVSPQAPPYVHQRTFSDDSSMARFSEISTNSSQEVTEESHRSTPFARRVRFNDDVQEFLYVSEIYHGGERKEPRKPFKSKYDKDDSFLGEVLSSLEFILDEMTFACTSATTLLKGKKKRKGKKTKITRSSAYDHY